MSEKFGSLWWAALLALFLALFLWGVAGGALENDSCYDKCFPNVGKVIDDKCHCAYTDSEWTLYGSETNESAVE